MKRRRQNDVCNGVTVEEDTAINVSLDAFSLAFASVLPEDDGHVVAQARELLGIAGHHEAVARESAFKEFCIEIHASIDDGLHTEHLLHAIEESLQTSLELHKRAFAALLNINDGNQVLLTGINIRAEVFQLGQRTGIRSEEVIDSDGNARAFGTIQVTQIILIDIA